MMALTIEEFDNLRQLELELGSRGASRRQGRHPARPGALALVTVRPAGILPNARRGNRPCAYLRGADVIPEAGCGIGTKLKVAQDGHDLRAHGWEIIPAYVRWPRS